MTHFNRGDMALQASDFTFQGEHFFVLSFQRALPLTNDQYEDVIAIRDRAHTTESSRSRSATRTRSSTFSVAFFRKSALNSLRTYGKYRLSISTHTGLLFQ
jgi:hypothetical protein